MTIRVMYSGLFFFIVGIITILTGLAFMLIVTRSLTQQEFGTWTLISGLIFYITLVQPITSYWIVREVARGEKSAKTGIISSGMFSSFGIALFIIISFFVSAQTDTVQNVLFFAAIMIPVLFLNDVFLSINMGFKPQVASFGKFALEISKIPLALFFIYFLDLGVEGVILSVTLAHIPSIVLLAYSARSRITGTIKREFIKKWIKLSWIPLYPGIYSLLRSIDVLVFSLITGSVLGLAYFGAALSVSSLVMQSTTISSAVYPKLLSDGKSEFLQDTVTKILFFAIPLSAISITFARPGLFALNPIYEIAFPLVIIITLRLTLATINRAFENFLKGVEKVDLNPKSTFKNYAQSKLFSIPTFRIIQNLIYLVLLIIILTLLSSSHTEFELVIFWAILGLLSVIPITIYLSILMKSRFKISLDVTPISKYFVSCAIIFIPLFVLSEKYLEYNTEIVKFLPDLFSFIVLGILGYALLTYIIDSKTKVFFNAIIHEIIKKIKN